MVEPNFYLNFQRAGQHLSDFFTCSDLKITDGKRNSGTVRVVAHCDDLSSLVNQVIQFRKISGSYFVKLGIDGGKKNLSLKGLAKILGSRDNFLLRYQKIETHSNIEQIWSLTNANGLILILACDMKVAYIICGL